MPAIILASASPQRRQLLAELGVPFDVVPADVDETAPPGEPPREAAVLIARRKAEAAAAVADARAGRAVVIGADTIVIAAPARPGGPEEVIGKPRDDAHAAEILRRLSGTRQSIVTGLFVLDASTGRTAGGWEETRVTMAEMTEREILDYVATGEPRGKAGAYGFRPEGDPFVKDIDGSFSNVLGLPLELLRRFLRELGVRLPAA